MSLLLTELRSQVRAHGLEGASILVAVSGGPDSLALLHALHSLQDDLRLTLHTAHLDHGLRSPESAEDAEYVERTSNRLGVPVTVDRADVRGYRGRHGLSLEDAARQIRYNFLARVASSQGADVVALAHTQDDQVETVLMNILRGSGLSGLSGMSRLSSRDIAGRRVVIFRPLLSMAKADTLAYCVDNDLEPRLDPSNLSTDFTRNRVRLELIPELERFNPAVRSALVRLAETAGIDLDFIGQEVDRVSDSALIQDDVGVSIDRSALSELHPAVQRALLRRAFEGVKEGPSDLELGHVEDMVRLMSGPSGKGIDLPGGLRFDVEYDRVRIAPSGGRFSGAKIPETGIRVPGTTRVGKWKVQTRLSPAGDSAAISVNDRRLSESFDADALGPQPRVRARVSGDRFQPLGMVGEKRLTDFMIDAHVPRRCRDSVPLVTAEDGRIAWLVGWRIADWAKVSVKTCEVLTIDFLPA